MSTFCFPLKPNASAHLLPEAGAQRTLEAVRCSGLLGVGLATDFRCPSLAYDGLLVGAQFLSGGHKRPLGLGVSQVDRGAISVA
jgi:hypothetical protein